MKLVAIRDADELLVQEMLAPLPLEQARSSLEFWRERRKVLPFHRRSERREADEMIHRWRARVGAAERARFGTGLFGQIRRLLAYEALSWPLARERALFGLGAKNGTPCVRLEHPAAPHCLGRDRWPGSVLPRPRRLRARANHPRPTRGLTARPL